VADAEVVPLPDAFVDAVLTAPEGGEQILVW
jgi:hypothetical protein